MCVTRFFRLMNFAIVEILQEREEERGRARGKKPEKKSINELTNKKCGPVRCLVRFGLLWFALALSLLHDAKFELCYNSALFVLAATSDSCRARWRQKERARERWSQIGAGFVGSFFALLLLRFVCLFSFCADFFLTLRFAYFP